MLLLRRGRSVQSMGSQLDIEVTYELGSLARRRHDCYEPWRPPTEVYENARELVARVEIGGLSNADVQVTVAGDELRIRGERSVSRPSGHQLYHESRIRYGKFEAGVHLPFPIEIEAATAEYIDGFLSVRLPRLAATRVPARGASEADTTQRGEH